MANENLAGASGASLRTYVTGFLGAILLTGAAFALVMTAALPRPWTFAIIIILALVQITVHLVYFLHLGLSQEQRWNMIALAYAVTTLGILTGGSIWIMFHLNYNMMAP